MTDLLGFLLLIPITRKLIFSLFLKQNIKKREESSKTLDGEIIEDKKDEL